ncbi:uncharacterized protein LOC118219952 isoform X2 [Anguilla anguilla]|uniref:uncharacterized protein LOC118219952 isoform X2 n=1 Tax=Anguilla anguilla TaxID=7936 RepID=UPI0015A9C880|nr:uncharacterized protein LOC118219952 isoform X2 [Anguilla anguilla]
MNRTVKESHYGHFCEFSRAGRIYRRSLSHQDGPETSSAYHGATHRRLKPINGGCNVTVVHSGTNMNLSMVNVFCPQHAQFRDFRDFTRSVSWRALLIYWRCLYILCTLSNEQLPWESMERELHVCTP